MASNERIRRSIEFQYGVNAEDLIKGTTIAENSIEGLEAKLQTLKGEFASVEIGSQRFNELGNEIQATQSKLKTLDERFEGLGIEQKNAMIVDSFNVVVGAVGAVTGALVAFGVESEALEGVEKRLLGIITVVSSLREVSNGLAAFNKIFPTLAANIGKATAALRAFALANPFTAILVAVTAVVGAIALLTQGTKEATEEQKKLREEAKKFNDDQDKINQGVKDRARDITLLGKSELGAAKARLAFAQQDLKAARIANNRIETELKFAKDQKASSAVLLEIKKRELESRRLEEEATAKVIEAEFALGEARKKVSKESSEASKKTAEDLAKAAVKQLNDQRQATEDLIDLYTELYPEKVTGGQFEFNTELDRTNFALQQQLDVLTSLNTEYEDLGSQLEEINFEESVSFFSQEQLAVFKKLRDANKTELQLQLDALDATYREDLALFSDNEEMKSKITAQYEEDRAKLRRQFAIKTAQDIIGVTSNFLNILAEINQQSLELQLLQAAGNQAAIDKINADALEKQKKLRIAQVLITTAESILNGFNATSTLLPPFNFIAGGALALAYTALGAKTIQAINATTLEGGGSTGGGFQNIPSGGGFSLPGGAGTPVGGSQGAVLPGLGGGRLGAPTIGTIGQEPIRAYVLAGDVENGVQANIALNNRRRLAGG